MVTKTPYVIAEAGSCGDSNLDKMIQQVEECAGAGADAVKFQWTSNPFAMAKRRGKALSAGYAGVYKKYIAWPEAWHKELSNRCNELDIDYMCAVYLEQDVEVIAPYVAHYKISSFEALDRSLYSATDSYRREGQLLFVSVGMCSDSEIRTIQSHIEANAIHYARLLYCVSAYPAPLESLDLYKIQSLNLAGFSDHTNPNYITSGMIGFLCGADYIEAHMRLETTDTSNPDFKHAMTCDELAEYIGEIRIGALSLGGKRSERYIIKLSKDSQKIMNRKAEAESLMSQYRVLNRPSLIDSGGKESA